MKDCGFAIRLGLRLFVRVIGFDGLWYGVDGFAASVMRVASVCVLVDWISN